jgi:Right handed beta helix region
LAFALASDAAAISRTFVASFGSDSNPCSLALPCRGFTVALAATDPGGEIVVLDSAGYGQVTIGKSVSITVPAGIYAGVSVLSGDGITVNAAGISVALTNLTINGQGGRDGIRFVQGARLNVFGCQISGMDRNGLRVEGPGTVMIARSAIRGSAQEGVFVGAAANVTIVRTRIQSSGGNGIAMTGGAAGTVARTLVFDSGLFGVTASQAAAGTTRIAVDDAAVSDNGTGTGVYAEATAVSAVAGIDVTDSLVTRNFNGLFGFSQSGGTAMMSATGNDIVENRFVGVTTAANSGGVTTLRSSQNAVFRNAVAGLLQSSGSLYTNKNYVRDNDGGDNFGAQPDSSL